MSRPDYVRARLRADITQPELAAEMRISRASIARFEAQTHPLPRARTVEDYYEAIERIKARRATSTASVAK